MSTGSVSDSAESAGKRRESHNAIERRRRDILNDKIDELASIIPHQLLVATPRSPPFHSPNPGTKGGKPNKGTILSRSVDYIKSLQHSIDEQNNTEIQLQHILQILEHEKGINQSQFEGTSAENALARLGIRKNPKHSNNNNEENGSDSGDDSDSSSINIKQEIDVGDLPYNRGIGYYSPTSAPAQQYQYPSPITRSQHNSCIPSPISPQIQQLSSPIISPLSQSQTQIQMQSQLQQEMMQGNLSSTTYGGITGQTRTNTNTNNSPQFNIYPQYYQRQT